MKKIIAICFASIVFLIGFKNFTRDVQNSHLAQNYLLIAKKAEACALIETTHGSFWCFCMQPRDCEYIEINPLTGEATFIEGRLAV
jgi:hypothetical protein